MGTSALERIALIMRIRTRLLVFLALIPLLFLSRSSPGETATNQQPNQALLVVVGAPGETEFGDLFNSWAAEWRNFARTNAYKFHEIGLTATNQNSSSTNSATDKQRLKNWLEEHARSQVEELWIIMIGHGTFDGESALFNLQGPDVAATELKEWLKPLEKKIVLVNCASASGPFIKECSAQGRIVITATRSGSEDNFARFGGFFSQAVRDQEADVDQDGSTSLLEAFQYAAGLLKDYYAQKGQLMTEHPLLEDNGDAAGTPADFYSPGKKKRQDNSRLDGMLARQTFLVKPAAETPLPPELRKQRDQLEAELISLRDEKDSLKENVYMEKLEALMIRLNKIYQQVPSNKSSPGTNDSAQAAK
jgi:hypothetical protein